MAGHRSKRLLLGVFSTFAIVIGFLCYAAYDEDAITPYNGSRYLQLEGLGALSGLTSLLGITKFTGPILCWLGVDLSGILGGGLDLLGGGAGGAIGNITDALPLDSLVGGCVCKDYQIESRIATSDGSSRVTIPLCAGTIRVEKPFDLTGKNVGFTCTTPFLFACGFKALGSNGIFKGSPIEASFTQTKFTKSTQAIDFTGGDITMTNVGFVNNEGKIGSAISIRGGATLTISQGTFRKNEATGVAPYGAGAIYVESSTLTMEEGGGFFDNRADGNGGAILAFDSDITLNDVTFDGNSAGGFGDAIAMFNTDVDLEGTIFIGSSSSSKNKYKDKHLRSLKHDYDDDEDDDDDKDDDENKEVRISDDFVRNHVGRYGVIGEDQVFVGSGNLIFIGDDENPSAAGSFLDCDSGTPPLFCSGLDILEIGIMFNNTNCREIGLGSRSSECKMMKNKW